MCGGLESPVVVLRCSLPPRAALVECVRGAATDRDAIPYMRARQRQVVAVGARENTCDIYVKTRRKREYIRDDIIIKNYFFNICICATMPVAWRSNIYKINTYVYVSGEPHGTMYENV